ncbi:MAG: alpha-1,2-fucosyltransferase [Planctomycetes bacterium]|nr:alpha-1,2-fucosyltransferase [Planctomycetota bacterium]
MSRYLLLSKKTGQLGNRLTVFAHCLAAARERGFRLLNPSFCEYAPFFTGPSGSLWRMDEPRASRQGIPMAERQLGYALARVAWQSAKLLRHASLGTIAMARARNEVPLDLRDVLDAAGPRCRLLILQGYHFRHHGWYRRHDAFIRTFLQPAQPWRAEGDAAVAELRRACAVVVGVHIRHGDYRQHLGGRFFFPVSTYVRFMTEIRRALAPRTVAFLVCSNAVHADDDFAGFVWRRGPGHLVSDLQALSRCDFIVGPPSSFSSWAAYHGGVPVLRVEDAQRAIDLEDFQVDPTPHPLY